MSHADAELALVDQAVPLLLGMKALIVALGAAGQHDCLSGAEVYLATRILDERMSHVLQLLARWQESEELV